jgi:hypothetical protein
MPKQKVGEIAIKSFVMLVVLGTACQAMAQVAKTTYPSMAPLPQYLLTTQAAVVSPVASDGLPVPACEGAPAPWSPPSASGPFSPSRHSRPRPSRSQSRP